MNKIICFLIGHRIQLIRPISFFYGGKLIRKCSRCNVEFGLPEFKNPPPPPIKKVVV